MFGLVGSGLTTHLKVGLQSRTGTPFRVLGSGFRINLGLRV